MLSTTSTLALALSIATAVLAAANLDGDLSPGAQIGDVKYLGCASEIPGRALNKATYAADNMTIESCQTYCAQSNLPLFGVEYGRECYCARVLAKPAALGQTGCDMRCGGNARQLCGGGNRISVFNATALAGPAAPRTAGDGGRWRYRSCFMEPEGGRAFDALVKADDRMTADMCVRACEDARYAYAGLEYGRECWCGGELRGDLEDASDPGCAMQCDMPCGGDGMQICGGRGAITVYESGSGGSTGKREAPGSPDIVDVLRARKGRFLKVLRRPHGAHVDPKGV